VPTAEQTDPARPGRPRGPSAHVEGAVLAAAGDELGASGFARFRMEAVAERAGVHRSTVYRHWPTKLDLLVAFAQRSFDEAVPAIDTGTWEGDLRALVKALTRSLAIPTSRALFGALASAGPDDAELQAAVLDMWRADTARHLEAIERAQARGEIAADLDAGLVLETISAPFIERLCVTGFPMTPHFIEFTIQFILRGTRPPLPH
jgi:AcrR family transcriptional regulator